MHETWHVGSGGGGRGAAGAGGTGDGRAVAQPFVGQRRGAVGHHAEAGGGAFVALRGELEQRVTFSREQLKVP